MRIIWSPSAARNLEQAAAHIALDKPEAARRWLEEVNKKVSRLKKFPKSGRIVPELGNSAIREIIIGNYRIIYKLGSTIAVLTLFHAAKPLKRLKA